MSQNQVEGTTQQKQPPRSAVFDVISARRSVREFDGRPIPQEVLDLLVEAARRAPSSCNTQPWHFTVVTDREKIAALAKVAPGGIEQRFISFAAQAAAIIVVSARPKLLIHRAAGTLERDCHLLDIGAAVEHMVLVAAELGLGSCWIGWLHQRKVNELIGRPRRNRVAALLALGYPKEPLLPRDDWDRRRRPREEISSAL